MKPRQILDCNQPLTGQRVRLQRLSTTHLDFLLESFRNEEFWSIYRINQDLSRSRQSLQAELEFQQTLLPAQAGKIEWVVELVMGSEVDEKQLPIGFASLSAIDFSLSQAELLIGIIDKKHIKPGTGLEASLLVMDYAFNKEKLKSLVSFVYADNSSAQKSTLALGFSNETLLQDHLLVKATRKRLSVFRNRINVDQFRSSKRLAKLSERMLGRDITQQQKSEIENDSDIQASFEL